MVCKAGRPQYGMLTALAFGVVWAKRSDSVRRVDVARLYGVAARSGMWALDGARAPGDPSRTVDFSFASLISDLIRRTNFVRHDPA